MSDNSNELNDLINSIDVKVVQVNEWKDVVDSSIISVNDDDELIKYKPTGVQLYGYSVLQNKNDLAKFVIRKHGKQSRHLKIDEILSLYYIDKFIVFQLSGMAIYFNASTGKLTRKKW